MEKRLDTSPEQLFRLLGDETRLRVLRVLRDVSLSVSEMVSVLDVPQSTLSRHLGALRREGLVQYRRDGATVWYAVADDLLHDESLMAMLDESFTRVNAKKDDEQRLKKVLAARRTRTQDFFDAVAGEYHHLVKPGGGDAGLLWAMMQALPVCTIIDVGCGEGNLALRLARLGHTVHAVDSSKAMRKTLKERARDIPAKRLKVHDGDMESLPLDDSTADLVLYSQVLHHASRPSVALAEGTRVCRTGGKVLIVDLLLHDKEWTREQLGDLWLGFSGSDLKSWMKEARLNDIQVDEVDSGGMALVCARGRK